MSSEKIQAALAKAEVVLNEAEAHASERALDAASYAANERLDSAAAMREGAARFEAASTAMIQFDDLLLCVECVGDPTALQKKRFDSAFNKIGGKSKFS